MLEAVLARLPAAVAYLAGPGLLIEFANDACRELAGGREIEGLQLHQVLPELASRGGGEAAGRARATGQPGRISEVMLRAPGSRQRSLDFSFEPVCGGDGAVAGVLVYAADVTAHVRDRQRLEELARELAEAIALRESTVMLGQLREANVLGVAASTGQGVYDANDAFLDMIGYSRDDVAAGRISYQSITAPEWAGRDREAQAQLQRTGAFQPYDKEYIHRDGHRVPVLVGGAAVSRHPLRWVTFVVDLTARQRAEQERTEHHGRERALRAQADHARERLTILLRAGSMVAATSDRHKMLGHAAELVVPALADHCVVFLPTADGALQATSVAHSDPARVPVVAEFSKHKIPAEGPMSIQAAYTSGTSQLMRDADSQLPKWHELAPGLTDLLGRLRAATVLSIPLLVNQRPAGVLALARDAERPGFTAADIELAEEFARRLASGIATADAFAREHTIAETLQRSLLPAALPQIAELDIAVSYLPASDGAQVGGDWYDAFPLRDGRVGLIVGDVTGHNITSAAVMGQIRSLVRGYALDHPDPGQVLQRTNDALTWLQPEALATAVCALLDPASGDLAYANAGHPPPLVTTPAGRCGYLDDTPGTMLGACPGIAYQTGHRRLRPGAGLLLYTDGLIEDRNRDISDGLRTLAAALSQAATGTAAQLCAAAEYLLAGAPTRADDICLLAVRRRES